MARAQAVSMERSRHHPPWGAPPPFSARPAGKEVVRTEARTPAPPGAAVISRSHGQRLLHDFWVPVQNRNVGFPIQRLLRISLGDSRALKPARALGSGTAPVPSKPARRTAGEQGAAGHSASLILEGGFKIRRIVLKSVIFSCPPFIRPLQLFSFTIFS